MKKPDNKISFRHLTYCMVMFLALSWLTISLPFVYQSSQNRAEKAQSKVANVDDSNPLTNTTEEKTSSGNSTLSEYLHETSHSEESYITITSFYKCHPSDLYFAFHPELISPPPEA